MENHSSLTENSQGNDLMSDDERLARSFEAFFERGQDAHLP